MVTLTDVVALCAHEVRDSFSLEDAVFVSFLVDWKHTLEFGHQLTDIKWSSNSLKNSVPTWARQILEDKRIFVEMNNSTPNILRAVGHKDIEIECINPQSKALSLLAMKVFFSLNKQDRLKLVLSTYPIFEHYDDPELNLQQIATEYKQLSFLQDKSLI